MNARPDVFGDDDLARLQRTLDQIRRPGLRPRHKLLQELVLEFMRGLYSDDGAGNGRLTAQGIDELREWFSSGLPQPSELAELKSWLVPAHREEWWRTVQHEVVGATLAMGVAGRREAIEETELLLRLFEDDVKRPIWDTSKSEYDAEMTRLLSSSELRLKYFPVLIATQVFAIPIDRTRIAQIEASCDTAILAIALERYRRRHNGWPAQLADLSPEFLGAVPIDPYDGQSIRYYVGADRPVVYSVGINGKDDTAPNLRAGVVPQAASDQDWQWLPAIEAPAK